MGKITSGALEITKPIPYGAKKIVKITRPSDGKVLSLGNPWTTHMSFTDRASKNTGGLETFNKTGYLFNAGGDAGYHSANFDSSPWGYDYMRHFDHAIGHLATGFHTEALKNNNRVRVRFVAGTTSGVSGTVQATAGDRGLAEGELEFWKEGGNVKYKLNYNKQYISHNGVAQRYYPAAINRSMSVGTVRTLSSSSWQQIAKFNYATAGGYWAEIYVRLSGNEINFAQKCDWHGARTEYGAFAIIGYDIQYN